ncbi:MAG: helix-turn-helix domain-containing protein [Bacillota bacterium]
MNKNYYAIIPATVRYNKKLSANVKLLYAEITALSNERGFCWATNKYFADFFGVDARTVQRWLKTLADEKCIKINITRDKKTNAVQSRTITLFDVAPPHDKNVMTPRDKNVVTPHDKNVAYNNIRVNKKRNIKENSKFNEGIISRNYSPEEISNAFSARETLDEF